MRHVLDLNPTVHSASIRYEATRPDIPGSLVTIGSTCLVFRQTKSGAKRGASPAWHPFTQDNLRALRTIAAGPQLVELVQRLLQEPADIPDWITEATLLLRYIQEG